MKVVIAKERCAGHARCFAAAPELYQLDENGYIANTGFIVPPGQEKLARKGARACPECIIRIVEDKGPADPASSVE